MKRKFVKGSKLLLLFVLAAIPLFISETIINNTGNYSSLGCSKNESYSDCGFAAAETSGDHAFTAAGEDDCVYIGGTPIGIVVGANGLIVTGTTDVETQNGMVSPLGNSDIRKGDVITHINGENATGIYQLRVAVEKSGDKVELTVKRGSEVFKRDISPAVDKHGEKRIGILAKEDVGGVGTLTFVTKNGNFAGLGHHIVDPESGLGGELQSGRIFPVEIEGIQRGERGKAGGLIASVNRMRLPLGTVSGNTDLGLYGKYSAQPAGSMIRIAGAGEVKMGAASLLTTINGSEPKLYDIDIVKVVSQPSAAEKGLVIAVRDKELLEKAGGIVQGMSGSPIVQNGLLVGAVTHVFINDPTRGYAVHSRFMLENADNASASSASEFTYSEYAA